MTHFKKFGLGAVATALFAMMATFVLAGTAVAAAPTTVNVIIDEGNTAVGVDSADDNDSIVSNPNNAQALQIVVDVDDAGGGMTDETLVTITTQIGTFSNGSTSITIQCANDGADNGVVTVDDDDTAADSGTVVGITEGAFNGAAELNGNDDEDTVATEQGCAGVAETLLVPAGVATGTYAITAYTSNGVADVDNLVVTTATGTIASGIAHVSQSHDAIGYDSGSSVDPWVNGSLWTVSVTDAQGLAVNGAQVEFKTDQGKLTDIGGGTTEANIHATCQSGNLDAMGTSVFATSQLVGSNNGRARVILCGTSGSKGMTANLTATLTGKNATATDTVTIAGEPSASDITVVRNGNTLEVTIMVGGVPAADDTIVQFQPVPSNSAVVSASCQVLHDGKASSTVAVAGGTVASILVTASDDSDGDCAAISIDETYGSVTQIIGGADAPTTPTTPTGDGTLTAPSFGSGNVGAAVFSGGTVAQLAAQVTAAGGTSVWAQTDAGVWVRYNTLATGATAFVNNAFNAAFSAGFAGPTAVFVVK